jgi:hypothetical protein
MNQDFIDFKESIEQEIHQVWMPHSGQLDIVSDLLIDFITGAFVRCGRKFGKTELAIYLMYMFGLLFENAEVYYVADEKDHARDILWDNGRLPQFFTTFRQNKNESYEDFQQRRLIGKRLQEKWVISTHGSEMKVGLHNGSKLKVDGAKNFSKADGLSPTLVIYDEFKDHDRRYDERMRPNLKALGGRICIIGTASHEPVEDAYYFKVEKEFEDRDGYKSYIKPCYENPHVYDGPDDPELKAEEKAYRDRGEYHIFAREYLSLIVPDTQKAIFPMFGEDTMMDRQEMIEEIHATYRKWDFYISYDPASSSVFAVLFVAINKEDKRFWILDEIYESVAEQTTVKHIYPRVLEKINQIYPYVSEWMQVYDYAEKWFQLEMAQEFDVHCHPCVKDIKNKEDSLSVLKDAMIYDRFKMARECVHTAKEYRNYKKDDKGKIPKVNDHNIDNTRYVKNAAYYNSVPREPLNLDKMSGRRHHTPDSDLKRINQMERMLGGDNEYYDDNSSDY